MAGDEAGHLVGGAALHRDQHDVGAGQDGGIVGHVERSGRDVPLAAVAVGEGEARGAQLRHHARARQEADVPPARGQQPPDEAADAAGPRHHDAHPVPPPLFLAWGGACPKDGRERKREAAPLHEGAGPLGVLVRRSS